MQISDIILKSRQSKNCLFRKNWMHQRLLCKSSMKVKGGYHRWMQQKIPGFINSAENDHFK